MLKCIILLINILLVMNVALQNIIFSLYTWLNLWEVFLCLSLGQIYLSLLQNRILLFLIIYRFTQAIKSIQGFLLNSNNFLLINFRAWIALMGLIDLITMRNDNISSTFVIYWAYWTRSALRNILNLFYYWILSNIRYRLLSAC